MMTRMLWFTIIAAVVTLFSSSATSFVVRCLRTTKCLRDRSLPSNTFRKSADSETTHTQDDGGVAVVNSRPCVGYPKCDGEYRDKGCDGSGR